MVIFTKTASKIIGTPTKIVAHYFFAKNRHSAQHLTFDWHYPSLGNPWLSLA
jgi:hypothetical protein